MPIEDPSPIPNTGRRRSPPPAPPPPAPYPYRSEAEYKRARRGNVIFAACVGMIVAAVVSAVMLFVPNHTPVEEMVQANSLSARQLVYVDRDCRVYETSVAQGEAGRQRILVSYGPCRAAAE